MKKVVKYQYIVLHKINKEAIYEFVKMATGRVLVCLWCTKVTD
jgi:hypothetical protein